MFDQPLESRERVTRQATLPCPTRAVGAPLAPLCPSTSDPLPPATTPTSSQFSSPLLPPPGLPPLSPSCSVELVDWGTDDEDDEPGVESQASPSSGHAPAGPSPQPQEDLAVNTPVETRSGAHGPVVIARDPPPVVRTSPAITVIPKTPPSVQALVEDKQAAPVSLLRRAAVVNHPTEGATAMAAPKLRSEVHVPDWGTRDHLWSYKDALLCSPEHGKAGRSVLNAGRVREPYQSPVDSGQGWQLIQKGCFWRAS
jgi:hypothetical protein